MSPTALLTLSQRADLFFLLKRLEPLPIIYPPDREAMMPIRPFRSAATATSRSFALIRDKPCTACVAQARRGAAAFSVLNRPPPNYPGHVPLTKLERVGLAVGSGIMALVNPYRHDLVAAFGEATAVPYAIYRLRDTMLASATGRRILRDRPRITSSQIGTVAGGLAGLAALPGGTVGRAYADWLAREGVSPDTRAAVRYVDDEECAYVMQRYRECHDFYHALTGLPVVREGEVALKALEYASTGLPVAGMSVLAAATMRPDERARFWRVYLPWAARGGRRASGERCLLNVYWEEVLGWRVEELRSVLGIEPPPDMRSFRREERERRRRREAGR